MSVELSKRRKRNDERHTVGRGGFGDSSLLSNLIDKDPVPTRALVVLYKDFSRCALSSRSREDVAPAADATA